MTRKVFLALLALVLALSAGLVACGGAGEEEEEEEPETYNLTIASTAGGLVVTPGEGTFTYDEGTAVNLVAEPEEGYQFVTWIGDMAAIADIDAAVTTISMSADHSIMASFELKPTGAFLDEVVITKDPDASAAIGKLKDEMLDVYASDLADSALYAEVLHDPDLTLTENILTYNELTFNPVGPIFPETGKLNPFAVPELREAMHWLVDREYIANNIMRGLAIPRYTCLTDSFADARERYPDLMAAVREKYAHNLTRAAGIITTEMEKLGAVLEDGKWMYNGEQVEIIGLIRTEDARQDIGDYFANLLEGLGFTVTRQYGTIADLSPTWLGGSPALGQWHSYTGRWIHPVISRDQGWSFGVLYTPLGWPGNPAWDSYTPDPDFYEAAEKLYDDDYADMDERADLFEVCLPMSMEDNVRMFLITDKRFSPMRSDVRVAHDLAGGVSGSWMWAQTAHFVDEVSEPVVGGTLKVGMPDLLINPLNPVAGRNSVFELFPIRATADMGLQPDTRTGLRWPGRIEKAEVFVQTGLPMGVTNTGWCSLEFVPEIQVPLDAWADWDAVGKRFVTVEERFGAGGTTAARKSVSYYPNDIFRIPLHDGSTLSMGDFILYTILKFDRAKGESAIFDESYVAEFNDFMSAFKGVRFITDDPDYGLIVEYYSDVQPANGLYSRWEIDAELAVTTMFPYYEHGPGLWHTVALGIRAEEDDVLAFSQAKSDSLGVGWMSFIDGSSLPILKTYLDSAQTATYIPYEPTMGLYVTEAEASERWGNLEEWYSDKGHFWVGSGPFYLESANSTEKIVHLRRFEDYPDPMDRWLFLLEPLTYQ